MMPIYLQEDSLTEKLGRSSKSKKFSEESVQRGYPQARVFAKLRQFSDSLACWSKFLFEKFIVIILAIPPIYSTEHFFTKESKSLRALSIGRLELEWYSNGWISQKNRRRFANPLVRTVRSDANVIRSFQSWKNRANKAYVQKCKNRSKPNI